MHRPLPMHLHTPSSEVGRQSSRLAPPTAARAVDAEQAGQALGGGARGLQRLGVLDVALLQWVRSLEKPWVTAAMRQITKLGDAGTWIMFGLILFACGGAAHIFGSLLAAAALSATALAQLLKRTCRRTRPSLGIGGFVALTENPDVFSFPSGHTCVAVAVAIALSGQGLALGPLMAALALGVGVSRVYLGAHYPLDVMAGAILGSLAGFGARSFLL